MKRRNNYTIVLGFFLCALSFSCSKSKEQKADVFSIDSLVEAQANYLTKMQAKVIKLSLLNGKSDSRSLTPEQPAIWKRELEIFHQLDMINKPINRDLYSIMVTSDSKSNLMVMQFSTQNKLPIKFLNIYYKNTIADIRRIEAMYTEENYLNNNDIRLEMEFDNIYNTNTLTNYHILGNQKMMLGDSVSFDIKGEIHLKAKN